MYLSISQAANVIGVSISTLRRWEQEHYLIACFRTKGGHRRYSLKNIEVNILKKSEITKKKAYSYARVSSFDQRDDLIRQENRLKKYCVEHTIDFNLISDLGSGINYNKKGLKNLINLICSRQVSKLIITHKDRLLRFGSPLLFRLCEFFDTEVIILDDNKEQTFEQELVNDVIEIMTVFTSKMYGKRSHQNKKLLIKDRDFAVAS
jgi:putative resolvase